MENQKCKFNNNVIVAEGTEFEMCVCDQCVETWEEIELLDLDDPRMN